MNFELQQAVTLLRNLLWLKSAEVAPGDRNRTDAVLDALLDAAFSQVEALMADWAREVEDQRLRIIQAQEQAAADLIAAEEQAARDAVQEEVNQAEREERSRAGVS